MVKQKIFAKRRPVWLWPAVGVLCVVLVGGVLLSMRAGMSSSDEDSDAEITRPNRSSRKTSAAQSKAKTTKKDYRKGETARKSAASAPGTGAKDSQSAPSAADQAARIAAEERDKKEAWRIADSNRLAKSEAILAAQAPRKYFDNEVENTLEVVSKPGAQFLILPQIKMSPKEALDYLKQPVEFSEDDDDEAIAAKKRTAAFKEEALAYVEKGGTLNQFIREKAAEAADEREAVDEIRREKDRILVEEGPEAAKAYLDSINPELKKLKLPEIRMGRADISKLRHQQRMLQKQQKQEKQK